MNNTDQKYKLESDSSLEYAHFYANDILVYFDMVKC